LVFLKVDESLSWLGVPPYSYALNILNPLSLSLGLKGLRNINISRNFVPFFI